MIIEVFNVSNAIHNKPIIQDVSFQLEKGRTFALLGPNGAGKTTMIRLLMGLLRPACGTIKLFGETLTTKNCDRLRSKIGVQNDGNLYESLSVLENLEIWGKFYGMSLKEKKKQIHYLLELFHLSDRANSKVGELSKGMKQKIALSRAILHQPQLLILDEPTSGLDPEAAQVLMTYLRDLAQQKNVSILMCTHQLHGLENLADDIGIIQSGKMQAVGSAQELLKKEWPLSEFEIEASPAKKAYEICLSLDFIQQSALTEEKKLHVTLKRSEDISSLIKTLVLADIHIFSVLESPHTIKELYFRRIEVT